MSKCIRSSRGAVISTALALITALASQVKVAAGPFTEVPFDPAPFQQESDAAKRLGDCQVVEGYPDGTFRGKQYLTRRALVLWLGRLRAAVKRSAERTGSSLLSPEVFGDVPEGHWAAVSVRKLASSGILIGFPGDGAHHPRGLTTRREAMTCLAHSLGYRLVKHAADQEDMWDLCQGETVAAPLGIVIEGYPEGGLHLDKPVTRFQFAIMVVRMIDRFCPEMKCP